MSTTQVNKSKGLSPSMMKLIIGGVSVLIVGLIVFLVILIFMGGRATGGKDSLIIANAYVDAIVSGDVDSFKNYIPNEAVNSSNIIEQMELTSTVNKNATLKYSSDASFRAEESYSSDQIELLKTKYGFGVIDEARDVKYSASYTAKVNNENVNGEEIVVITTIRIGDAWYYIDAKDVKNRYKKDSSATWTDLIGSPVEDSNVETDKPTDDQAQELPANDDSNTDVQTDESQNGDISVE